MSASRAALIIALASGVSSAAAAVVEGTATIAGRPAAAAVIYLEAPHPQPAPTPPPRAVMDQKNLAFAPAVLPVVRGTLIKFTNSDDVQHNVFSPSAIAGKFNLGTYGPGAQRAVTLTEPGDVLVLCNIHMEMEARILVLDGPFFAIVGVDGRYRIADVPLGVYAVKIWQERWLPFSRTLEVTAAGALTVDVAASE